MEEGVLVKRVGACIAALALVMTSTTAHAAPTKDECINANEAAQASRAAGRLRDAKAELTVCISKSCPGPVRDDCTEQLNELQKVLPTVVFAVRGAGGTDIHGRSREDGRSCPHDAARRERYGGRPWPAHVQLRGRRFLAFRGVASHPGRREGASRAGRAQGHRADVGEAAGAGAHRASASPDPGPAAATSSSAARIRCPCVDPGPAGSPCRARAGESKRPHVARTHCRLRDARRGCRRGGGRLRLRRDGHGEQVVADQPLRRQRLPAFGAVGHQRPALERDDLDYRVRCWGRRSGGCHGALCRLSTSRTFEHWCDNASRSNRPRKLGPRGDLPMTRGTRTIALVLSAFAVAGCTTLLGGDDFYVAPDSGHAPDATMRDGSGSSSNRKDAGHDARTDSVSRLRRAHQGRGAPPIRAPGRTRAVDRDRMQVADRGRTAGWTPQPMRRQSTREPGASSVGQPSPPVRRTRATSARAVSPATSKTTWTSTDGANGGCPSGAVCSGNPASCQAGCWIGGTFYAPDATTSNGCEACKPTSSTTSWTNVTGAASCPSGEVCNGTPAACTAGCYIKGTGYVAPDASNPGVLCQSCQPATSTSKWSTEADGTGCGVAQICSAGNCVFGCFVDGAVYQSGDTNPGYPCQSCDPAASTTAWTDALDGSFCNGTGECSSGSCVMSCAPPGGDGMTNCGSSSESCCTSLEVAGGTYYRTYDTLGEAPPDGGWTDEADQATVSGLRLDKYLVTVGRFRQFVAAWAGGTGYLPPAASGKHAHLNAGQGLMNSGATGAMSRAG